MIPGSYWRASKLYWRRLSRSGPDTNVITAHDLQINLTNKTIYKNNRQVIINLLDNGIKFSPVNSSVEVCLQSSNKQANFIIKDGGIGIPKQDLEKVFDRFYRAENAASVGGTGLGLAIAKEIITSHQGTITLSKRPKGEGTKLEVSLPQP